MEERFRMLYLFPCRRGALINVVAHHVDDRDLDKLGKMFEDRSTSILIGELEWNTPADVEEVYIPN